MYSFTINVRRRHLALALVLVLIGVWITRTEPADAGTDPPGEGIAVVYVAVGTGFADALGVGPGAGLNGAPVIIVPTNPPMNGATATELVRLDPRTVIIIGGTSAVSDAMEDTIVELLPNAAVSRISGGNRYETNAAFSQATYPIEGWIALPAVAFISDNPDADDADITPESASNLSSGGVLNAPVHLPQGAEILELRAEVFDGTNESGVTVELHRYFEGATTMIATVSSPAFGGDGETVLNSMAITQGLEIVDNSDSAYLIKVTEASGQGDLYLRAVMVRYRVGAP